MVIVKDMDKLREDTAAAGFTYSSLAKKINVSKTTIGSVYTGKRNPSAKVAFNICKELNKPFERYFFVSVVHNKEQE